MVSVLRISKTVLMILLLMSCRTKKNTIEKFDSDRSKILHISNEILSTTLPEDEILITSFKKEIEISCHLNKSHTVTFYLNKDKFNFIGNTGDSSLIRDNVQRFEYYKNKVNEKEFRKNVKALTDMGIKGIKIKQNWFFITYGAKGVKLQNPDVLTGVLISTNKEVKNQINFIEALDENVYLYDSVLR